MKRVFAIALAVVLAFGLAACSEKGARDKIGIRGEITNLSQSQDNKLVFILVEGALEADTSYDKASIKVSDETRILEKDSKKKLKREDLKEGMQVEVLFDGPVAESYPVQTSAKEVRILK